MMTNRQLLEALKELSEEELDLNVTVAFDDEFYGVSHTDTSDNYDNDPFDISHPTICVFEGD